MADPYTQTMPSVPYAPPQATNDAARPRLVLLFRVIHVGLCMMMAAVGVLSFMGYNGGAGFSLSNLVVPLYLLVFSAIWFAFEITQIKKVEPRGL